MSLLLLGAGRGVDGSGAAFTPASVPGLDFWLEPSATTLFTDLGSTNVTADGQSIEQWNDKSSASRNMTQASAGSRPIYKTDLAKPSVQFPNTGAFNMTSAGSLSWTDGSGQMWLAVSLQSENVTGNLEVVSFKNGGTYIADLYLGGSCANFEINSSSGFEGDSTAATLAINTPFVVIGTITTAQTEVWLDNSSNGASTNVGTPSSSTGFLGLGIGGSLWPGRIFGVCHGTGTLSSTDRANLQTYMAALHP